MRLYAQCGVLAPSTPILPGVTTVKNTLLHASAALLALGLAPAAVQAQAGPAAEPLSYAQAEQLLLTRSDRLAAAAREVESARLRREAMQGLGGPSVAVTGTALRSSANADISLDPARQALSDAIGLLPPPLAGAVGQVPQLPSSLSLQRQGHRASANFSLLWPLYIGGLGDAVRGELDAMAEEAEADASAATLSQQALLAQRYFGAQLAARAAQLRERALAGVREHADAADGMLRAGVISELERLQARAALADAEQQARKARDDARLAATALASTLKAGALLDAQEALRRPQVLGFGMREINSGGGKPNWAAGLAVRYTLWDSVDRDRLAASAQRKIEQAELTEQQALADIALLVEKNWLAVDQARTQYLAQQAQEELARELLRLRAAALRGGTGTALELIDAELNLARVQTERAQTAHQYVQALAALLESTGQAGEFERYMAQADIQITPSTP